MGKTSPIPLIRPDDAVDELREIAKSASERLFFSVHAEQRMIERDITRTQVRRAIHSGQLIGQPGWETDSITGECGWKCKFRGISAGARVTVIAKLVVNRDKPNEPPAVVVTVFGD